jgi:hypothetical protein
LAQDASGYWIKQGKFHNTENLITGTGPIPLVTDRPSGGSGPSGVDRKVLLIDSAGNEADASDWRTPIINYLRNPSVRMDRNVQRTTFKYVFVGDLFSNAMNQEQGNIEIVKCYNPSSFEALFPSGYNGFRTKVMKVIPS